MKEFWTKEKFFKKVANDPQNWQHSYPNVTSDNESCTHCGNKLNMSDLGAQHGLCRNCRHNPGVMSQFQKEPCAYCDEPITDSNETEPGEKFCEDHRLTCEDCGDRIPDLGQEIRTPGYGVETVEDDETHCPNCRRYCEDCGNRLNGPDSDRHDVAYNDESEEYCPDCRSYCQNENCGERIHDQQEVGGPDDERFCEEHRQECRHCGESIQDLGEHDHNTGETIDPDYEDECEGDRAYCEGCSSRIWNRGDVDPNSGRYIDYDETHCPDCQKHCASCDEPITDIDDRDSHTGNWVDDDETHCADCRTYCTECGDRIEDQEEVGDDAEQCEEHRKYCLDCKDPIDDQGTREYAEAELKKDIKDNPLSSYCSSHRDRCKLCAKEVPDAEHEKAKNGFNQQKSVNPNNWWEGPGYFTNKTVSPSVTPDSHEYCPECRWWAKKGH